MECMNAAVEKSMVAAVEEINIMQIKTVSEAIHN